MTIWFTSDEHYKHKSIIKHCPGRFEEFGSIDKMEGGFISRHNEVVKPDDVVWHIGDFCWLKADNRNYYETLMSKLNGEHHLVLGNHDYCSPFYYVAIGFTTVHTALQLTINKHNIIMSHDPCVYTKSYNDSYILLCGHVHTLFKFIPDKRIVNVGVDVWKYYPISLETIIDTLEQNAKRKEKLDT